MEKRGKILAVVLFAVSFCLNFVDVFRISTLSLSLTDLMGLGFSGGEETGLGGQMESILREYIRPYSLMIAGFLAAILVFALLTAVLKGEHALRLAAAGAVILAVCLGGLTGTLYSRVSEIRDGLAFFGLADMVELRTGRLILWMAVYVLILVCSMLGLRSAEKKRDISFTDDILPESFQRRGNPWENHQDLTEVPGREDYLERIQELEAKRQQKEQNPGPSVSPAAADFEGAIVGQGGIFKEKAFPMKDRVPVYFCQEEGQIFLSARPGAEVLTEGYYVRQYQEYCVTPAEKGTCFLASGQPLGPGRHYYLPRGTRLYIREKETAFELA